MDKLNALAAIALDLTAEISAEDRHDRLLGALHRVIPWQRIWLAMQLTQAGRTSPASWWKTLYLYREQIN